jgi:hypothetical protein
MKKYNLIAAIALMGAVPAIAQEAAPGPVLFQDITVGMLQKDLFAAHGGYRFPIDFPGAKNKPDVDVTTDRTSRKEPYRVTKVEVTIWDQMNAVEAGLREKFGEPLSKESRTARYRGMINTDEEHTVLHWEKGGVSITLDRQTGGEHGHILYEGMASAKTAAAAL